MWVVTQRTNRNKGILEADRFRRLEELGFVWDPNADEFEKNFAALVEYKEKFGAIRVPADYRTENGLFLGIWVNNRRAEYRKGILDPERFRRLEELGLVWKTAEEAFEKHFAALVNYKEEFESTIVPQKFKTQNGLALGVWVNHQRISYKKGTLKSEQIKRLDEIGFVWNLLGDVFEQGLATLIKYKRIWPLARAQWVHHERWVCSG